MTERQRAALDAVRVWIHAQDELWEARLIGLSQTLAAKEKVDAAAAALRRAALALQEEDRARPVVYEVAEDPGER